MYTPHNMQRIYIINLNEVEILVNSMCFAMLFHDPLNECLNFKKYEYWSLMVNLNMSPIHVKCIKIILYILASMGLHDEIISFILNILSGNKNIQF